MPMVKDGHLGGFVDGGDIRCFYPEMWDKIIADLHPQGVMDIGCGQGHALAYFEQKGVAGIGIDGSEKVLENAVFSPIIIHDYTKGPYLLGEADLAWCCEFLEHVEAQYIPNFMATLKQARYVAVSHALPGQGGYHHVNEQDDQYWIDIFTQNGFIFNKAKTDEYRALAHDYFQKSGLFFENPNV